MVKTFVPLLSAVAVGSSAASAPASVATVDRTIRMVTSGTCNSNGYATASSAAECIRWANSFGILFDDNTHETGLTLGPSGCYRHSSGNLDFNPIDYGNTCSDTRQCLCKQSDQLLRIAFYVDAGAENVKVFYRTLEAAAKMTARDFSIQNFTAEDVRTRLSLDSFDVAVFPGGSGNGQAKALGDKGLAKVRSFVRHGGGYMGTCGGAFLGMQHLHFYGQGPAGRGPRTQDPFDRGHGPVQVEFTQHGLKDIELDPVQFGGNVTVMYWQGPVVKPQDLPSNVSILSWFRTEIHSQHTKETTGEMVNTPAMTSIGYYGGRVALNSPHPEMTPNLPEIYAGELAWVTKRPSRNAVVV